MAIWASKHQWYGPRRIFVISAGSGSDRIIQICPRWGPRPTSTQKVVCGSTRKACFDSVASSCGTLLHDGLRQTFKKSTLRPVRVLSVLDAEVENYMSSQKSCVWLVGIEKDSSTTIDVVRRVSLSTVFESCACLQAVPTRVSIDDWALHASEGQLL